MADKDIKKTEGLPQPPPEIVIAETKAKFDWKRVLFILLGLGLFLWIYFMPAWPDAVDPIGKHFALSQKGKGAIALFLLAGIWWVFEVVPIGVTAIAIGVFQAFLQYVPQKTPLKISWTRLSCLFLLRSLLALHSQNQG